MSASERFSDPWWSKHRPPEGWSVTPSGKNKPSENDAREERRALSAMSDTGFVEWEDGRVSIFHIARCLDDAADEILEELDRLPQSIGLLVHRETVSSEILEMAVAYAIADHQERVVIWRDAQARVPDRQDCVLLYRKSGEPRADPADMRRAGTRVSIFHRFLPRVFQRSHSARTEFRQ
jgi:hypothetical protein